MHDDRIAAPHRTDARRGSRKRVAPGVFERSGKLIVSYSIPGSGDVCQTLGWLRSDAHPDGFTLTQAKAERERLRVKTAAGEIVAKRGETVADVAADYFVGLESRVARGERSSRTLEQYRQAWRTHIEPELGGLKMQAVTAGRLDRFVSTLRTKTRGTSGALLSDWTLRGTCNVLGLIFKYAHKRGLISANPIVRIADEMPVGKNRTQARVLDADDVRALIDSTPEPYRAIVTTAAFTGMRVSEVLGLTWADVDLDGETINVVCQLSRARRGEPARRIPLKTKAGERTIDMAPVLVQTLRRQKVQQAERRLRGGAQTDYVFATSTGAPVNYRNAASRGLEKGADAAGVNRDGLPRLSFHDLRHTAITHLIRSGADVSQVQRFAGHAKPSITLDLYVGEFDQRRVNDSGRRLAAIYAS